MRIGHHFKQEYFIMKSILLLVLFVGIMSFNVSSAKDLGGSPYDSPYELSSTSFGVSVATPPAVTSFTPTSGTVGASVLISGSFFSGALAVKFNGTSSSFIAGNDSQITATVPASATTGTISVQTPGGTAISDSIFKVLPKINSFTPAIGPVGTLVSIFGTTLSGTTDVSFNGISSASVTNISPTEVQATVPIGATTGPISLTTPDSVATSGANFVVDNPPSGGTFSATPDSGLALTTSFTLKCSGWTDPDLPLTYRFSYRIDNGPEIFLSSYATSESLSTVLPAGDTTTNTVSLFAYIRDGLGLAALDSFDVIVEPGEGVFNVNPDNIDFGELPVDELDGSTKLDSVIVTNTGTGTLHIISVVSDNILFTVQPAADSVAPSAQKTFFITFHATSAGEKNGDIVFTHDAADSPDTVTVTGIGNDTTKYRTATYDDWANALDAKGKRKSIKRKNDKVEFKLNIVAPNSATGVTLKLSMPAFGAITSGKAKLDTVKTFSPVDGKEIVYTAGIDNADTFQVEGVGIKGSRIKISAVWQTSPKAITVAYKDLSQFKKNYPRLPKPNLHNVGEELFPKGFGQVSAYFAGGLQVGIPQGPNLTNAVKHLKYSDILASLVKVNKDDRFFHDGLPRCLDFYDVEGDPDPTKPIKKLPKSLPPVKSNNSLFAEVLALKLDVAASATNKFPNGLGELTYQDDSDPFNPFNGQLVTTILQKADSMLACLTITSKLSEPSFDDLYNVVYNIDSAFSDTVDTNSFAVKTSFTGVLPINDVPYLHKTPGVVPVSFVSPPAVDEYIPVAYRLDQNYPNPFNPTTTIQFNLPERAVITLKVYNMLGQEVTTLLNNEDMDEGVQEVRFDAGNFASGVYFYRLVANGVGDEEKGTPGQTFVSVKKMMLLK